MSKIRQYIDIHRKSRKEFMSIADFNRKFKATLPENASVEKEFHNDIRKKRRIAFPVRGNLYDIEAKLGLATREARRSLATAPRAISVKHRKGRNCGCKMACDCSETDSSASKIATSMRPSMRRSNMKLRIRSAKRAVSTSEAPKTPSALAQSEVMPEQISSESISMHEVEAPVVNAKHMGHKRYHKHGKHKESERNRPSLRPHHVGKGTGIPRHNIIEEAEPIREVSSESTVLKAPMMENVEEHFSVREAAEFYAEHNPEYLDDHDIEEEVRKWNSVNPDYVLAQLRNAYRIAPGDHWTIDDVTSFYNRVDPQFLEDHDVNVVMDRWRDVERNEIEDKLMQKYASLPDTDPTWTPQVVEDYYLHVNPKKLDTTPAYVIANEWNQYSREETIKACMEQYGVAPGQTVAFEESPVEQYQRELRESGQTFNATKLIHFVPKSGRWDASNFASHCAKMKKSYFEIMAEHGTGPFKMLDGSRKTFKSINRADVKKMFKGVKANRGGHFFIEVEL